MALLRTVWFNNLPKTMNVKELTGKMQIKNRTAQLWSMKNRVYNNWYLRPPIIKLPRRQNYLIKGPVVRSMHSSISNSNKQSTTSTAARATANSVKSSKLVDNLSQQNYYNKWWIITGMTLVIGTIIFVNNNNNYNTQRRKKRNEQRQRLIQDKDQNQEILTKYQRIKIFRNNWLFFFYSTLPLNTGSRLWGKIHHLTLPMWLRPIGYKFYSYLFNVNLDEMIDSNLYHYKNLAEFFYRTIRSETRPIQGDNNVIVSPSDGQILQMGIIDSETGEIEQVKGLTYSIKEFLGTHTHPLINKSESNLNLTVDENEHIKFAKLNNFNLETIQSLSSNSSNFSSDNDLDTNIDIDLVTDDNGNDDINLPMDFKLEGDRSLQSYSPSESKTVNLLNELSLNIPYSHTNNNNNNTTDNDIINNKNLSTEPSNSRLYFTVIYLSPGDYHHYHSPINWVCQLRRHFPGDLFSVSPFFQRNFPNLFILNERVALLGYWKYGFFSMTPVGATNVGSIKLNFDKDLITNVKKNRHLKAHTCYEATFHKASNVLNGMPLMKGEEMGGFELGSTVVLCFEAPDNFKFNCKVGDKIKLGEKIGTIMDDPNGNLKNKDSK